MQQSFFGRVSLGKFLIARYQVKRFDIKYKVVDKSNVNLKMETYNQVFNGNPHKNQN